MVAPLVCRMREPRRGGKPKKRFTLCVARGDFQHDIARTIAGQTAVDRPVQCILLLGPAHILLDNKAGPVGACRLHASESGGGHLDHHGVHRENRAKES